MLVFLTILFASFVSVHTNKIDNCCKDSDVFDIDLRILVGPNDVDNCCCKVNETQCGTSIVFAIDPRTRTVGNSQQNTCPHGTTDCCDTDNWKEVQQMCSSSTQTHNQEEVIYGCEEDTHSHSVSQCGIRNHSNSDSNLKHGESSQGEFPWVCQILNDANLFVAGCTIIPGKNETNTNRVVTVAHRLSEYKIQDKLKVCMGQTNVARDPFDEYEVENFIKHPQFKDKRYSHNIAIIYTKKSIILNKPSVKAACLPSCKNQFSYTFKNGTGIRCWVTGWGKKAVDGPFTFIQHKTDLPLVNNTHCEDKLKIALNNTRFSLSDSEICAGGEIGKDACEGDGGYPLVCQAQSGRWTVVGLVAWGKSCGTDVPGVYAKMSYFTEWINNN